MLPLLVWNTQVLSGKCDQLKAKDPMIWTARQNWFKTICCSDYQISETVGHNFI